jgi:hypothetical protein
VAWASADSTMASSNDCDIREAFGRLHRMQT